jgi:hypothetical protein
MCNPQSLFWSNTMDTQQFRKETLTPILQVAKDLLTENKKEMHVNEMAKAAVFQNKNMGLSEEEFAKRLSSTLAANLKTKNPSFSKPLGKKGVPRKGYYRLKKGVSSVPPIPKPQPPSVNNLYVGKAGEYAVAAELLFWGFNVAMSAVDEGIDLIAEKSGKFNHIQVKTAIATDGATSFNFGIQQKAFDACQALAPWYVFVIRTGIDIDYAVIPTSQISLWRNGGIISGKDLSIQISRDDKRKHYKLNGQEINMFINNFGLI